MRKFAKLILEGSGTFGRPAMAQYDVDYSPTKVGYGPAARAAGRGGLETVQMIELPFTVTLLPGTNKVASDGGGGGADVYAHLRSGDTLWIEDKDAPGGGHRVKATGKIKVDERALMFNTDRPPWAPNSWTDKPEPHAHAVSGCIVKTWQRPDGVGDKIEGISLTANIRQGEVKFLGDGSLYDMLTDAGVDVGGYETKTVTSGKGKNKETLEKPEVVYGKGAGGQLLIRPDGMDDSGWVVNVGPAELSVPHVFSKFVNGFKNVIAVALVAYPDFHAKKHAGLENAKRYFSDSEGRATVNPTGGGEEKTTLTFKLGGGVKIKQTQVQDMLKVATDKGLPPLSFSVYKLPSWKQPERAERQPGQFTVTMEASGLSVAGATASACVNEGDYLRVFLPDSGDGNALQHFDIKATKQILQADNIVSISEKLPSNLGTRGLRIFRNFLRPLDNDSTSPTVSNELLEGGILAQDITGLGNLLIKDKNLGVAEFLKRVDGKTTTQLQQALGICSDFMDAKSKRNHHLGHKINGTLKAGIYTKTVGVCKSLIENCIDAGILDNRWRGDFDVIVTVLKENPYHYQAAFKRFEKDKLLAEKMADMLRKNDELMIEQLTGIKEPDRARTSQFSNSAQAEIAKRKDFVAKVVADRDRGGGVGGGGAAADADIRGRSNPASISSKHPRETSASASALDAVASSGNAPTADKHILEPGTTVNGVVTYTIVKKGPDTSNSIVYRGYAANSVGSKSFVALKQVTRASDLTTEAGTYFDINPTETPHLAFLRDVAKSSAGPLLVLDWAEHGTLEQWITTSNSRVAHPDPTLRSRMAIGYFKKKIGLAIEIVRGLQELHDRGRVHQDLKPSLPFQRSWVRGEDIVRSEGRFWFSRRNICFPAIQGSIRTLKHHLTLQR